MPRIRRAILSLSDKTGAVDLARGLGALSVEILSTGGTARLLREHAVPVTDVSEYTGAEEILEGRVKTLHPRVHGAILARREVPADLATLERLSIPPIDLVCVNFYPFEGRPSLEEIDIGGPTLVRAAAKNWPSVAVVVRPEDYAPLLEEMRASSGEIAEATRRRLAATAFARIAELDLAIAAWMGRELRYGENPHQRGALVGPGPGRLLSGKDLSYTNLVDVDAALGLVRDLPAPAACVVKHATPCGAARGADAREAFERAYQGDALSAYGGIVGLNVPVTEAAAAAMSAPDRFLECVIAPGFEPPALEVLTTRPRWGKSVRLIEARAPAAPALYRSIAGGILFETPDQLEGEETLELVTRRRPSPDEEADLRFAIAVAKHARSNAIAVVRGLALAGVGAGQTSRVEAVEIALRKSGALARGASLASDAFFPFRDSIDLAAKAGIAAIVAPRGSRRDSEVVAAADELGLALAFTDLRHFRH